MIVAASVMLGSTVVDRRAAGARQGLRRQRDRVEGGDAGAADVIAGHEVQGARLAAVEQVEAAVGSAGDRRGQLLAERGQGGVESWRCRRSGLSASVSAVWMLVDRGDDVVDGGRRGAEDRLALGDRIIDRAEDAGDRTAGSGRSTNRRRCRRRWRPCRPVEIWLWVVARFCCVILSD